MGLWDAWLAPMVGHCPTAGTELPDPGFPGAPLTPETFGFPLGQARRTQVLLATLSSSTGDVGEETSWVGYILANSAVPSGCCVQHWLCHGPPPLEVSQDNMGVAHPQQATPTLLFPSSSFHNTESN